MKRLFLLPALLLAACSGEPDTGFHGYAEGDYAALAPLGSGRIESIDVREGDTVSAGAILFTLDTENEDAALAAAEARLAAAEARFDDAAAGGRAPEIAAVRDQLSAARASAAQAQDDLTRARELFERGVVPRARLDDAEAAATAANARVSELRERVTVAELPAREGQLRALTAEIEAAQASVTQAREALARRRVSAPSDGRIERQIRFPGELAGPGQPVLRFLPDGAVFAVLFIPEEDLSATPSGTVLAVSCDGCPGGLTATVTRIDSEAEFTPPIIYSDNERARLVWRAEARFEGEAPPPGTPLALEPRG